MMKIPCGSHNFQRCAFIVQKLTLQPYRLETYRAKAAAATTAYGRASLLFAIACSTLLFQDCCIPSASCNTTHHQAGPYADPSDPSNPSKGP